MTSDTATSQRALTKQHSPIDQWYTESFASPPTGHESESRRHGFFVGKIGILLPNNMNCEVTENLQICKIPNSPKWFSGMTNLRGNIVPLFDLGILFNQCTDNIYAHPDESERKQLFLEVNGDLVGFSSDGLPTRIMLDGSHLLETIPPAPSELEPFIVKSYKKKDIWFDLNMNDLLLWITERF